MTVWFKLYLEQTRNSSKTVIIPAWRTCACRSWVCDLVGGGSGVGFSSSVLAVSAPVSGPGMLPCLKSLGECCAKWCVRDFSRDAFCRRIHICCSYPAMFLSVQMYVDFSTQLIIISLITNNYYNLVILIFTTSTTSVLQ